MLNSLYIGKVIYDSDLLNEGDMVPQNRVKVFITGITPSVSEDFNHPRGITNENIMSTKTLDIAGQEFYAYVMMPVMGSGTGATYNANTDILTVSDTGNSKDLNACPPAEAYSHVHDGYIGGNSIGTAGVNVTANAYSPDNRSNSYKGMMALPSVGATVVVSFINNVRSMPVILGILPSVADVNSIHGVGFREEVFPNYPMAYSNLTSQSEETNPTISTVSDSDDINRDEDDFPDTDNIPSDFSRDYSDIPPGRTKESIDSYLKYGYPELAAKAAADYRRSKRESAALQQDTIRIIREEVGDAAANRAAGSLDQFHRENNLGKYAL